jgi:hypothetical protein
VRIDLLNHDLLNHDYIRGERFFKMSKDKEIVTLEEMNIFMRIPENTTKLKITATVEIDGKKQKVSKKIGKKEIQEARQDFLFFVEDGDNYNAPYVLTDKGKEFVKKLISNTKNFTDEEREIYESWLDADSRETGENL